MGGLFAGRRRAAGILQAMAKSASKYCALQATAPLGKYRPEIDGLRAVAISAVIAYHFWNNLLPGGFLGVDMFFVISGYVITASLSQQAHRSIQDLLLSFYCRRIKRLAPALLLCVVITSLLGTLFIYPQSEDYSDSMKAAVFSIFGLSNIYFTKEALNYFGTSAHLNLFMHTWSLGVEEQFYLLFPALLWISGYASRQPKGLYFLLAAQVFLSVLSLTLYIWLSRNFFAASYFMMPSRFWELSIGCLTALACLHWRQPGGKGLDLTPWVSFVIIAITLATSSDLHIYTTPAIVIGTALLILRLRPGHLLYRLLTVRSILVIGLMSYSLYLWHWGVLALAQRTIGVHGWTAPLLLAVILGLAALSYFLVERPLRQAEWSASKLVSVGFGLIAAASTAGAIVVLQSGFGGMLYAGTPVSMAAKGVQTLRDNRWYAGSLQWRARDCILSSNSDVGKEISAHRCTLQGNKTAASARHFLVVGDSFSAAEFEMYSALSESGLGSVIATSTWAASPVPEFPNASPWAKANAYYWGSVVPTLMSGLSSGDFVIMINDLNGLAPAIMNPETLDRLALLKAGLLRLTGELRRREVQVIFQSQNPLMREAGCTPDMAKHQWFNTFNSSSLCQYYSKVRSIDRIRPLYEMLEDLQGTHANFHVLDLLPVLCPGDVCRFYDEQGVFLYRDEFSHPSIEANYLTRPAFLAVVNDAIASLQGERQGSLP